MAHNGISRPENSNSACRAPNHAAPRPTGYAVPSLPTAKRSPVSFFCTHFLATCQIESRKFVSVRSVPRLKHPPRGASARARACLQQIRYHNVAARNASESSDCMYHFRNCMQELALFRTSIVNCVRRLHSHLFCPFPLISSQRCTDLFCFCFPPSPASGSTTALVSPLICTSPRGPNVRIEFAVAGCLTLTPELFSPVASPRNFVLPAHPRVCLARSPPCGLHTECC